MTRICQTLVFGCCFLSVFCSWMIPRLTLTLDSSHLKIYEKNVSHTVFYLQNGSENLLFGTLNSVQTLNDSGGVKTFSLTDNGGDFCLESTCETIITVIEEFQNLTFVCGTNGKLPKCWKLDTRKNNSNMVVESFNGRGISPYTYSQNCLSLVVDGDLYAAAPLYLDGTSLQFRRQAGSQNKLWMYDAWITDPMFISAFVASRPEDPMNEKIYVFFREKNPDNSPEADPWISRVARVCKTDQGGPKRFFQNIWTSFLKARLVCTIPGESLYFNRLKDVFVLHAANWKESRVYALFSSSWNATAVCIYSLAELDGIFENSSFKGYSKDIPNPRPGTCVRDSRHLEIHTIRMVRDHPEMDDWIHPIQKHAPFYISNNNYTKIAVDQVQASDEKVDSLPHVTQDSVKLNKTKFTECFKQLQGQNNQDTGTIQKIVECESKAFIISETRLCNISASVLSMKLNSEKRKLFVGYPGQISVLDLQRCQDYTTSCEDCVLARDPYCAWNGNECTSQVKEGIQNIATGEPHICSINSASKRHKRDVSPSFKTHPIVHIVHKDIPFYLSCPTDSHHATYSWKHRGESKPCQRTQTDCLYLIPAVSESDYGMYTCVSRECNYDKIVKAYQLRGPPEPRTPDRAFGLTALKELLLVVLVPLFLSLH